MFQRRSKRLGFGFLRSVIHERNDAVRLGPQFLIGCRTDQWRQLHSYGWESNFMFGAHSFLCGGFTATGGNPSTVWVPLRMFSPGLKPVGAPSLKPGAPTDKIVLSPCTQGSPNQELVPVRIARSVCMHAAAPKTPLGSRAGAGMMPYRTLRLPGANWGPQRTSAPAFALAHPRPPVPLHGCIAGHPVKRRDATV